MLWDGFMIRMLRNKLVYRDFVLRNIFEPPAFLIDNMRAGIRPLDTFPLSISRRIRRRNFPRTFRFFRQNFDIGNFRPSPQIWTEKSEIPMEIDPRDDSKVRLKKGKCQMI